MLDGQNSVISIVISKWLLPELSIPAAGQKDRRLWGRECEDLSMQIKIYADAVRSCTVAPLLMVLYQHITAIPRILLVLMQHALVKSSFDDNNNSIPTTGTSFFSVNFLRPHIVPVLYSEKHERHNTFLSSQGFLHP